MRTREAVEAVLRLPHLIRTMVSARAFSSSVVPPPVTDPQSQFRMRACMDLHPGVGKWVSRRVVRQRDLGAGRIADPAGSRFIDTSEIERAVEGIRRDGWRSGGPPQRAPRPSAEPAVWDDVTELCGPAGTLMAVDTIGLHKGNTPVAGDRLVPWILQRYASAVARGR